MVQFFLTLFTWTSVCCASTSNFPTPIFINAVHQTLEKSKKELDKNTINSEQCTQNLKKDLDNLWSDLINKGHVEKMGSDAELRPLFITMQGILEQALTSLLKNKSIQSVNVYIVTPKMPTSFMLDTPKILSEVNFQEPTDFACFRHQVLTEFLTQEGSTVFAIYAHDALKTFSKHKKKNRSGIGTYYRYLKIFNNKLKNYPVLNVNIESFPPEKSGALYYINGTCEITI